MARTIELAHAGAVGRFTLEKIDRAALYGAVDTETRDADGRPCRLATLASDGRTVVPSGETAFAYMAGDGRWLERSALVAVDAEGRKLNTVASSFSHPLELEVTTTANRLLDHAIRLAYVLDPVEAPMPPGLVAALAAGQIFKTDFSYRGGVSADPAFVMQGSDGNVWLLVGEESRIDYVGFNQAAGLAAEDEEAAAEDEIDFEMM